MQKGWLGASEVNRVGYDPQKVTVEQMERWLKEAGTYIRTAPEPASQEDKREKKR